MARMQVDIEAADGMSGARLEVDVENAEQAKAAAQAIWRRTNDKDGVIKGVFKEVD